MPTIELKITLEVPDGTNVNVVTNGVAESEPKAEMTPEQRVRAAINENVPTKFRSWVNQYVDECLKLGCEVEPGGGNRTDYFNVYPPKRCRRVRVAGVTYSSSRTAAYTGDIDLAGYRLAQETYNGDHYAYPKLPQLDSGEAVAEAVRLTQEAIKRTER
jgi:hypothetical protein